MSTSLDLLHRFIFDDADIRGEIITLDHSIQEIFSRRNYPPKIKVILGEFLTAATLLSSTLKFDGTLTLQARGDGPLPLIMAEVNHHKTIRGIAEMSDHLIENISTIETQSLKALLGSGVLSVIIDPDQGERYQGIIELMDGGLEASLEAYFFQSAQLPSKFSVSCNGEKASGMLLQRLPQQIADEDTNRDAWETQVHLASTLSDDELLNLPHDVVLTRLFHESKVRVFDPESFEFRCTCSRERSSQTLKQLGRPELESILEEEGEINVDCHFCGYRYQYNKDDISDLFKEPTQH